jgi:hypothetical protein
VADGDAFNIGEEVEKIGQALAPVLKGSAPIGSQMRLKDKTGPFRRAGRKSSEY